MTTVSIVREKLLPKEQVGTFDVVSDGSNPSHLLRIMAVEVIGKHCSQIWEEDEWVGLGGDAVPVGSFDCGVRSCAARTIQNMPHSVPTQFFLI